MSSEVAAVILAAGASTRLGEPKQLLIYKGLTFIENCIGKALKAKCLPVVVVLGANSDKIIKQISGYPVEIVINDQWQTGMGTSISAGIRKIESLPRIKAAVLMVCDQPYISKELIENLINTYEASDSSIVACTYKDTEGVPALFDRSHFSELTSLSGNEGAKRIIKSSQEHLATIPFEEGVFDIDTWEDYKKLSGN